VLVLTGAGPEAFCAGADLKAIETLDADDPGGPLGFTRTTPSKPAIAAIAGYALAGGLELALWCDLRVAAQDAVLGVFCRRWGVPLIDGGTVRLPRLIGHSHAMDLILTGRPVLAEEALTMGLVNRVAPPGQALARAQALAAEIAAFPQVCLRSDRASALEQWGLGEDDALAAEFGHGLRALEAESLDGATRFAEGAGRHGTF
jgi:enoyl-CoA hydratase